MRSFTNMLARGACCALLATMLTPAYAKIDLVTLPERDETEITVYNSQDLTLAREKRTLSLAKGLNQIQFSWADTMIDPTSLRLYLGAKPGLEILDAVYPTNTSDLIVWNIEAEEATVVPMDISYFISGLSWEADYVIISDAMEETLSLQPLITIRNHSGEDFENTKTRVVIGDVNLEEEIRELAKRGIISPQDLRRQMGKELGRYVSADGLLDFRNADSSMDMAMSMPMAGGRAEAAEIIKKAVSEYHLFAVEGEEDIRDGWGKQLPNPTVTDIEFDLSYEINPRLYGPNPVLFYKFKNTEDHELGKEPMPAGDYKVYGQDDRDGLRYVGGMNHDYVAVGDDVELNLGSDGRMIYEERLMDVERRDFSFDKDNNVVGWIELQTMELEIRNTRDRDVPLKLTHYIDGDWEFENVSHDDFEKISRDAVRWEMDVKAQEKLVIEYTTTVRMGSLARN